MTGRLRARAQGPERLDLRIGVVVPAVTGRADGHSGRYELVGEAVRLGAMLGAQDAELKASAKGDRADVLIANAPSPDAVVRAARRLIATEEVAALVGGVGPQDAALLSHVAEEYGVLFMNIGDPSDLLRTACARNTFHVEASAAMYLDATVTWFARSGPRRWFLIYETTGEGRQRHARALEALGKFDPRGEVVGEASVVTEQPLYIDELSSIRSSGADVVLLLSSAFDQVGFLAQQASIGPATVVAAFPEPVTQTREFIAATTHRGVGAEAEQRVALWDATLSQHGAEELNQRFSSRFAMPMDPVAWAAYQAIQFLHESADALRSTEAAALTERLEGSQTRLDGRKGVPLSFRAWDHQLRQPLYVTETTDAAWGASVTQKTAVARLVGSIPEIEALRAAQSGRLLDGFGDGPDGSSCWGLGEP